MGNFLVLSPNFPSGSYYKFRNTKGYRAFYALPFRGGMGWGFYFFFHSIYPAPAIAKRRITIEM